MSSDVLDPELNDSRSLGGCNLPGLVWDSVEVEEEEVELVRKDGLARLAEGTGRSSVDSLRDCD